MVLVCQCPVVYVVNLYWLVCNAFLHQLNQNTSISHSISSQTHTLSMQDTGQHDTVVMRHDGWVKRQVTNVEIIPCPMDLTRYPFDSQVRLDSFITVLLINKYVH